MNENIERVRVKISTANVGAQIMFEPVGTNVDLTAGEEIFLELPLKDLAALEICVWDGGVDVVLPYPGDHVVLDSSGNELLRI